MARREIIDLNKRRIGMEFSDCDPGDGPGHNGSGLINETNPFKFPLIYLKGEQEPRGAHPIILSELLPRPVSSILIDDTPEPPPLISDGLLYPGTVLVIGGASKARKSWLSIDLALSCAAGLPFLTHGVPEKLRVLYLGGEGMEWKLKRDFAQAVAYKEGVQEDDLTRIWAIPTLGRIKIDSEAGERWLNEQAAPFQVIVIDPYYRFISQGDENSHRDQRRIQDVIDGLKARGKAVVIAHHLRKPQGEDAGAAELRGAGLDGFADSILILRRKRSPLTDRTTIRYTLRNAPEPPDLELEANGPLLKPIENPNRLVTVADVRRAIIEAGGRIEGRATLIETINRMTAARERSIRTAIQEAENGGAIWSAKRTDDKRGKVYVVSGDEE